MYDSLHYIVPIVIIITLVVLFGMLSTAPDQELQDAIMEIDRSLEFNNDFASPEEVITMEVFGYDFSVEDQEKILTHYRKKGYNL